MPETFSERDLRDETTALLRDRCSVVLVVRGLCALDD